MVTVVYIAGYGRSGSTLLELALSAHPRVVGFGELAQFGREYATDRPCACGSLLSGCAFWSEVLERARLRPTEVGITGPAARKLLAAAAETADSDFVVDSSKTTRRTLRRPADLALDNDLFLVHLVRSAAAVAEAAAGGTNKQREAGSITGSATVRRLRTLVGWTAANRAALWATRKQPSMVVQFEQFLEDPSGVVSHILSSVGLDPIPAAEHLAAYHPLAVGHGVGGNRVRRSGEPIVIKSSSQPTSAGGIYRGLEYLAGVRSARMP